MGEDHHVADVTAIFDVVIERPSCFVSQKGMVVLDSPCPSGWKIRRPLGQGP